MQEVGIQNNHYTVIADKGFGSDEDFALLDRYKLNYLIPLKRKNRYIKDRLPSSQKDYEEVFTYHGWAVQYKRFDDGCVIHLYYDAQLYADELATLLQDRKSSMPLWNSKPIKSLKDVLTIKDT